MTLPWGRFRESTGTVPGLVGLIGWTFLGRKKNYQFEIVIKYAFKEAFPNRFPLENLRNPFRQLVPHRFPAFPSRNTVRNILKVEKVSPNQNLSKIPNFCLQFRFEFRPATSKKSVPWLFPKKNPHQKEPNPPKRLKNQTQEKKK